jgi:hypothetical protein
VRAWQGDCVLYSWLPQLVVYWQWLPGSWAVIFIDVRPAFSGLFHSRLQPEEVKQSAGRA